MKIYCIALICSLAFFLSSCGEFPVKISFAGDDEATVEISTDSLCIPLTQDEFLVKVSDFKNQTKERKYLGDKPAIIDFYATWCKPCKELNPILEELAGKYQDQIYVYKVDIDKNPELKAAFKIRAVPVFVFIAMDGSQEIVKGSMSKEEFQQHIEEFLLKRPSSNNR